MKTLLSYSTIMILFAALSSSCSKEESNGGNTHYYINENLYPLLFDTGSYWIYENFEDNSIDTVFLENCREDTLGPTNIGKGYTQTAEIYILDYNSTIHGNYTDTYVGYIISRGTTSAGYIYLSSFDIGTTNLNASIANIYDSLEINGVTYNNVVKMKISQDDYIETDMNLYFVDSIGIVQRIDFKNQNDSIAWQLVDFEVELLF